jgi:DNA recombination-dependent growth factor C
VDRRKFLKGLASAAVLAVLPGTEKYTHKTYGTAHYVIPREALENAALCPADLSEQSLEQMCIEIAESRSRALAKSMMQTREQVTANVLNRAFEKGISLRSTAHPVAYKTWWDPQLEFLHVEGISREEMYV